MDERLHIIPIHSPDDPRASAYANQKDAWLRAQRGEDPGGLFVAEGELVVRALIDSGYRTRSVLLTPTRLETMRPWLHRLPQGTPVYLASREVMSDVVGFHIHRGILALGARRHPEPIESILARADLLVVLEDLANHDNVGGIFRSVSALGRNSPAVILSPRCCDPLYRKSLRVSMGHVLRVPFTTAGDWPHTIDRIRDAGFQIIALTPAPDAEPLVWGMHGISGRLAILVGAEGPGLSQRALASADRRVCIPMRAGVDSLNVVTALSIALFCLRPAPNSP